MLQWFICKEQKVVLKSTKLKVSKGRKSEESGTARADSIIALHGTRSGPRKGLQREGTLDTIKDTCLWCISPGLQLKKSAVEIKFMAIGALH